MKKQTENLTDAALLRQKAEEQLSQRKQGSNKTVSETDMLKLIHELEVHQIELEMQNEELTLANNVARIATEKYEKLYNFAPSGYFTLSPQGKILEMNLRIAQMLGKERSLLINSQFELCIKEDSRSIFANFLDEIFKGKSNAVCDIPISCNDKNSLYLHLTGVILENRKQCHVTAIDITERKKVEEVFKKNLAKYKVLIDTFPIAITISDPEGKIIETNEKALELLGLQREEHLKRKLKGEDWKIIKTDGTVFPPDEYASVKALKENRLVENIEMGIVKSEDEITWINVTAAPIPIEDFGVVIAYSDITERKNEEEQLRQAREKAEESEKRFRKLMESIDTVAVQGYGPNGITQFWNKASEKLYGYTQQEAIGSNLLDLIIPPEMKDEVTIAIHNMAVSGEPIPSSELLLKHKDGLPVPVLSHHAIVKVPGQVQELFCLDVDISKRKILETELKESEERFNLAMKATNDGLFDWNLETNDIYYSPGWKKMLGYEDHELPNDFSVWEKTTYPEDVKRSWELQQKLITKQIDRFVMELKMKHKDGHWVDILSRSEAIFNDNGKAIRIVGTHTDISERKKAESVIKMNEENLRKITESMQETLSVITLDGTFLYANQKAVENMSGGKSNDITGMNIRKLIPKEQSEFLIETYQSVYHSGKPFHQEIEIGLKKANVWFFNTLKPIEYGSPPVPAVLSVSLDITEQKLAEKELLKAKRIAEVSEERFNLAMKASNDGIFDWNLETNEIYYSPGWKRMLGYEDHELPNDFSVWEKTTEPEYIKKSWELQQKLITKQIDRFVMEFRMKHKDAHWVDILSRAEAIFNDNGKAIRIVGTHTDITERKKAEELINQEKLFNEMLIESLPGIFYMFDSDFKPLKWNRNKAELLGLTDEEMKTHNTLDYIANRDKEKIIKTFEKTFHEGTSQEIIHILNHEGSEFAYHLTGKRLETANGPVLLGVGIDVTDRIKAENELVTALNKAEESDRLKSAFLANMSHEIRTPMNGILGFADLLKQPGLTGEKQQAYIAIIEKSGIRMLNIINQIINISKIEAGQMELNIKESDINAQIVDIYNFFKPEAEAKLIKLSINNALSAEKAVIKTDIEKLYAVLTNLVKNALKYTQKGSIEFGYKIVEKQSITSLQFYVKDTGIGIPKDRQEAIFERFIQADISDIMARQGAGLGLAISKAYVEMLDGKIWVESEEGIGSTFYFTIPYSALSDENKNEEKIVQPQDIINHNNPEVSGYKVLLAEDDEISEMLITIDVEKFCKTILKAGTGNEAVEISRNNPDIDLILMDIQMPGMNGYEATRQIRQFNKEVVIIAQTAFGMYGDREKAIEAGCNDYISKPINKSELLALIQKYLG